MLGKILPWKKHHAGAAAVVGKNHSDESLEGALLELWRNVALPKEEFYLTYAPVIRAAMAAVDNDIERKVLYKRIRFVLIASNGVIFGRTHGLDVEDSMVMSQVFAFAATAAIAVEICAGDSQIDNEGEWHPGWELFTAHEVLSKEGWEWLTQYPPVFNDWLACFMRPERSEIKKLLETKPRKAVVEKAPRQSAGAAYLLWLKHKLTDKEITFNEPKAHIHVLAGERVFLTIPSALQRYAGENDLTNRAVEKKIKQLNVHEVDDEKNDTFGAKVDGKNAKGMILLDARVLFDEVPDESDYITINDSGEN